jgi:hypothetical protein
VQVGPADVAHKQRIAGQHSPRAGGFGIENGDADGLRRVARRLQNLQPDAGAQAHGIAVLHRREAVFRSRAGAQVNGSAHAIAQLQVAGDEVGVRMCQKDVAYLEALLLGIFDIPIHVPLRVHHGSHLSALVCDEVRSMRQAG